MFFPLLLRTNLKVAGKQEGANVEFVDETRFFFMELPLNFFRFMI